MKGDYNMKKTIPSTLGKRIAHLRKTHKMSQKVLSDKIGVGYTTISNYESDYSSPSIDKLKQLAMVFGVDYSYLIDDSPQYDEKLLQSGIIINRIPYYKPENTNGIITGDIKLADSYVSLPSDTAMSTDNYICTKVTDNSMSNIGLTNNTYIIINKTQKVLPGSIVAVFDTIKNTFIVRKLVNDGPMVLLISDGYEGSDTISTNMHDNEYMIIGTIEKAIINF
jgi:transcriptional regulator with XRE-family HTH domain